VFFFSIPKKDFSFFRQNNPLKPHLFDKQEDAGKKYFKFYLISDLTKTQNLNAFR